MLEIYILVRILMSVVPEIILAVPKWSKPIVNVSPEYIQGYTIMYKYVQSMYKYIQVCPTPLRDARWSDPDPKILKIWLWNHCIVQFSTVYDLRLNFLLFMVCDAVVVGNVLYACLRHARYKFIINYWSIVLCIQIKKQLQDDSR